jgi:TRAP-type C4-dicarboxylate transport system permease small subunit
MLDKAERAFILINQVLVVVLMMSMAGLVMANVVTRYLFQFSLPWAEELSRFTMIWVTYLAAGLAMREGHHVAFEYLQSLLPERVVPWVRGFVAVGMLLFLAYLTFVGWQFSQLTMRQMSAVLQIPRGIVGLAIPIGAAVFGLHLLMIFRQYANKDVREDGELPPIGAKAPEMRP